MLSSLCFYLNIGIFYILDKVSTFNVLSYALALIFAYPIF